MKAYGTLALTKTSPVQTFREPFKLADAKDWLYLPQGKHPQDQIIESLITTVRVAAEKEQGKDLVKKQWDRHLDVLMDYPDVVAAQEPLKFNTQYLFGNGYSIDLRYPLCSVDTFQYTDNTGTTTTLVEGTDYIVDKNRALVTPPYGKTWSFVQPQVTSAVLLRFTSGYTPDDSFWLDDGQLVKTGMRLLLGVLYDNRTNAVTPDVIESFLRHGARTIVA